MDRAGRRLEAMALHLDGGGLTDVGAGVDARGRPLPDMALQRGDKSLLEHQYIPGMPTPVDGNRFPEARADIFSVEEGVSPEARRMQLDVREYMESVVAPKINQYWEKAEFPWEFLKGLADLNVMGGDIQGYGSVGLPIREYGQVMAEVSRVDASVATFMLVQSGLVMHTIGALGSEAQKRYWLPKLAKLQVIGGWGLTEPENGSDAANIKTRAEQLPDGRWRLNGRKRWIGNAPLAHIVTVWAKDVQDNEMKCFIVDTKLKGFYVTKQEGKIALRCVQNGDILMDNVIVPSDAFLPKATSFRSTAGVLLASRVMVAWVPVGMCAGLYDVCKRYVQERVQFGVPIGSSQLVQEKLMRMAGNVQAMRLIAIRVSELLDDRKLSSGQAALAKAWNTLRGRECAALAREILGGNGILSQYHVAKVFGDMEAIFTYEGTYDINSLAAGRELLGYNAIKLGK